MDPVIKTQWVEALRSGKYVQGKRALCRVLPNGDREYCCLGVLCEVLGLKSETASSRDYVVYRSPSGDEWSHDVLPRGVLKKAGLNSVIGGNVTIGERPRAMTAPLIDFERFRGHIRSDR